MRFTDPATEPQAESDLSRRTLLKASAIGAGLLGALGVVSADEDDEYDDEDDGRNDEEDEEEEDVRDDEDVDDRDDEDDPDDEPAVVSETADVVGQGPDGDVVAADGAKIWRTENEILVQVSMPAPEPGEYTYPSEPPERDGEWWTDEPGEVEAFSLWAFVFDYPEECENDCDSGDLGDPAGGGAFDVSGMVAEGGDLTLNGVISTDTDLYEDDGEPMGEPLERPMEAEVHLAVAPHGAFDPDMMPDILQTPTGPGPDVWWTAIFD